VPVLDSRFKQIYEQGNIPTSISLPFTEVLNEDKTFKTGEEVIQILKDLGIHDPTKDKMVITCQRGITACILQAALDQIGNPNVQVYDGSWEEFSRKQ